MVVSKVAFAEGSFENKLEVTLHRKVAGLNGSTIFELEINDDTLLVKPLVNLSDVLFEARGDEISRLLATFTDNQLLKNAVVDLSVTPYFGSDFIGVLLQLWKKVEQRHGNMALCNVSPEGKETLGICELDQIWPICADRVVAISTVTSSE